MKDRFTIPNPNGAGYRIPACRGGSFRTEWQQDQSVIYGSIADRLGAYEDIGTIEELRELKARKIKGAVLDMFELIPNPITNPFRRLNNVVVLPGVAAVSEESKRRLGELIKENVRLAASGQRLNCIVSASKGGKL